MANTTVIKIEGARELRRKLNQLDRELASDGIKRVHLKIARLVEVEAKREAPVRSGRLAGDIRAQSTTRQANIVVGRASIPYAGPIHWGWYTRPNPDRGWWGGPIRANRFLVRAAQRNEDRIVDEYSEGVDDLARRVGLI